jgi:hypothetical protein
MYLEGQHVDNGWIRSTFTLTHRVSWEQMLQAIYAAFDYFTEIVIFVDEKKHRITSRDEVLSIPESWNVSIAGTSLVFKVPMIIFFYNQVQFSNVRLRCVSEDLRGLTYEQFNKMVGPLMNALELAMFQEPVTPSQAKETAQSPVRQDTGAPTNASQKPGGAPINSTQHSGAAKLADTDQHAQTHKGGETAQHPEADRPHEASPHPEAAQRSVAPIPAPPPQPAATPPQRHATPPIPPPPA